MKKTILLGLVLALSTQAQWDRGLGRGGSNFFNSGYNVQVELWAGLYANQRGVGEFIVRNIDENQLQDFYYGCRDSLYRTSGRSSYGHQNYRRDYPVRTVTVRFLDPRTGQVIRDRYTNQARAKAVAFGSQVNRFLMNETEICSFASILASELGMKANRWRSARYVISGMFTESLQNQNSWGYDGWNQRGDSGWRDSYDRRYSQGWNQNWNRDSFYFEFDSLRDLDNQCYRKFGYDRKGYDLELVYSFNMERFTTKALNRYNRTICDEVMEAARSRAW